MVENRVKETIKGDDNDLGYLYTIKEVIEGIIIKEEDDITTNLGVELEERFDPEIDGLPESDFDEEVDGDKDIDDENI